MAQPEHRPDHRPRHWPRLRTGQLRRPRPLDAAWLLLALALLLVRAAPVHAQGAAIYADHLLLEKAAHRLTLFRDGAVLRTYYVALGKHPKGPKLREGDGRTPEGHYIIDGRNPHSLFHMALHISYPNEEDRERAAADGYAPGGDIMIHGIKNGAGWIGRFQRDLDWTQGCVAVTDHEIEEIWRLVPDGTPIDIVP